jgi:rhamnose utilization protein RhaD (predicted bifunctional aldolase and dehydrogenase)
MDTDTLEQLVQISRQLGNPELDYAILGEGNTSARADAASFWVKASGVQMATITASGFVRVAFERILPLLQGADLDDAQVRQALSAARLDSTATAHPSVETLLHALLLQLPGVNFVGHTHPTAVNMLACSIAFPEVFQGRLFPDEIVLCGVMPLLVPYTDPGIPLARSVQCLLNDYLDQYGERPRIVIMQNHGLIALGSSAQQVADVTAMAVKSARVLWGANAAGGAHFLSEKDVSRIHTRPDELYRRQQLGVQK